MGKQSCKHGSLLPRGLKCDRGFLIIRLKTPEGPYNKGCGPHTPAMEKIAKLALEDIRIKQRLGSFNLPSKLKRITFDEATEIFHQKHFIEYRDPKTNKPRSAISIVTNKSHMNALNSFFGRWYLDALTLQGLEAYRKKRLEYDGCAHGTVNRDMALLGSMIRQLKTWVLSKKIDPIMLPKDETGAFINPCEFLPDLQEIPRNRIASVDELKRLKAACYDLKDPGMWCIIETELTSCLRKSDLKEYLFKEAVGDTVTLVQSKTGLNISLPKLKRPDWAKVWTNFDARWERVRLKAVCADLQFRDLRKTGLRMAHDQGFSVSEVSSLAGHADEKTTKKHYLDMGKVQAVSNTRLVEALEKVLKGI